jgi:hypothetical protein
MRRLLPGPCGPKSPILTLTALVLSSTIGCSSTTQTNVIASDGTGGTGEFTTGGSGNGGSANASGGQAGAPTTGNGACSPALAPDLHASCVEDLGQGVLRLSYDFAAADQLLDWSSSPGASVSVSQKALVVTSASNDIGVAILRKKLHVYKTSYQVTLLAGNTTNWYINTVWDGRWNPAAGYGGYHDYTGRGFLINGSKYTPADVSPLSVGVLEDVVIEQTDTQLSWTQVGVVMTENVAPVPVTDRNLALGAWESSAAFYNLVIEATLN